MARRQSQLHHAPSPALLVLGIVALTLVVFWPAAHYPFLNYDDTAYVVQNPHVRGGLEPENLSWALTAGRNSNWHPLTWWSHMLDSQLWGMRAAGHHLTNLLLHVASAVALFLFVRRATGDSGWRSWFVAALFAVHPLHVESVAWVAERKDVLSGLFFMLTLLAYVRAVEQPSTGARVLTGVLFALGLMAKPMLVTLPLVLVLLDAWPLDRWRQLGWRGQLREKLPLLALSLTSSAVTFLVQRAGKAVGSFEEYSLWARLSNALVSYVAYLGKTVWPWGLAVFYPHPGDSLALWQPVLASLLLASLVVVAWRCRQRYPYLLVGLLWYVGMLVPVIGLVQVGEQAMADRYTYLPLVGPFIAIVWGVTQLWPRGDAGLRLAGRAAALGLVAALAVVANFQVRHWRSSEALFRHALDVTRDNHIAHINLALALTAGGGEIDQVVEHLREAVRLKPDHAKAQANLGVALNQAGLRDEAHEHLLLAVEIEPGHAQAHFNLGISFEQRGEPQAALAAYGRAIEVFEEAAAVDPILVSALVGKANLLGRLGRHDEAIRDLQQAIGARPRHGAAHLRLAEQLYRVGRYEESRATAERARQLGARPSPELLRRLAEALGP